MSKDAPIYIINREMSEGAPITIQQPPVAGYYCIGSPPYQTKISMAEKPSWWHRFWMKTCLGWKWE